MIWRKSHTFRPGTNFYGWCCRIAVLEVFKTASADGGAPLRSSDSFLEVESRSKRAENVEVLEERRRALLACLSRLVPADRELIRQRDAPSETGKSLARKLGRPANSVYQSLSRIRRALMECVKRRMAAEAQT